MLLHVAIERRLLVSVANVCVFRFRSVVLVLIFAWAAMCCVVFVSDVEGWFIFSDARCCRGGEALIHRAAESGDVSCLEFLVARNADVNAQTK